MQKKLLVVTELFNIAINDFDTKKSVKISQLLFVSRTVCLVHGKVHWRNELSHALSDHF